MPIRIILLLLGLSYLLLCVSAIPATRTHNLNTQDNPGFPFSTHQIENGEMQEQVDMGEGFMEMRRMDFETQDYGTGAEANRDHNPKIPV